MKTSLVYNQKKPCLQHKQGFFEMRVFKRDDSTTMSSLQSQA